MEQGVICWAASLKSVERKCENINIENCWPARGISGEKGNNPAFRLLVRMEKAPDICQVLFPFFFQGRVGSMYRFRYFRKSESVERMTELFCSRALPYTSRVWTKE